MLRETDALVDKVVAKLNAKGFPAEFAHEVPRDLQVAQVDQAFCQWVIRRVDAAPWAADFEDRASIRLPDAFRSLIHRYTYWEFRLGPILMFANTGRQHHNELAVKVNDIYLNESLHPAGLFHFAGPATGDYDPVCFDTKRKDSAGEYPIVRVDHEQILCNYRIKIIGDIAPSFRAILEDVLRQGSD